VSRCLYRKHVKTKEKGAVIMAGNIAKQNEKIVINRDFSVIVPEGYTYSTNKWEINEDREFVFIKTEQNALFKSVFGDFADYGLDEPFSAPQCMTIMEPRGLDAELDLSNPSVRTTFKKNAEQFLTMFGGTLETAKESKDILVYYSKFEGENTNAAFIIVTTSSEIIGRGFRSV
jgi:hypothetical protein